MIRLMILILCAFGAEGIWALDVCPVYKKIHDHDVVPRIKSGIPLRLLSIATGDQNYKSIIRVEFDLWSEMVSVAQVGKKKETCKLKDSAAVICRNLSFPEAPIGKSYDYRLLLNPLVGGRLRQLQNDKDGAGKLIQVNWERLIRDLETEKVLLSEKVQ
jgi:hypothetical protein